MAKEFAKKFYSSKAWKQCRDGYISDRILIDGGLCEECHDRLGYIVHHTVTLTPENINNPDITLNHNKLQYVCKDCHDRFEEHWTSKKSECICLFDECGQVIGITDSPLS